MKNDSMENKKAIEKINQCIGKLVYEKSKLKKAYNYYHCIRDADQFRHLEENFGLGVPTSIGFTPLIKKHIDVLVGEYLELDPELQVTCKDERTLSNIMRDKKLKIDKELYSFLEKYLQNAVVNILLGSGQPVNDPFIEKEMQKIQSSIEASFVSEYELAAQNILDYIKHSRDVDLKNKLREMFTDLLITGTCYYRVKIVNDNIRFEILNPLDTFIERNQAHFYLNHSPRSVIRRYLTVEQIIAEFGNELSKEALDKLKDKGPSVDQDSGAVYVRVPNTAMYDADTGKVNITNIPSAGILGGLEVSPVLPYDTNNYYTNRGTITVYETEWLEYEKGKYNRHEGVKIGDDIFICRGEAKNTVRSQSNPDFCTITVNGMFFSDKNGQPFSLVLNTMDLQDKYDLLIFCRDNLIASSGTVGDWIDLAHLPSVLGVALPERLEKWLAYKKNGLALFDSSQEGATVLNTTFNGFDDTIKAHSIQAIQMAIEAVELNASSITGVFQEKLGGIQPRDAVSNVAVGIRQSTLLTKQYFHAMDLMFKEVNYDCLNNAKLAWKNGLTGTIVLGPKLVKTFTALPEHYTVTDFDIHIQDSSETFQTRQEIKGLNAELIRAGLVDVKDVVNIATAKNITDLKRYVEKSILDKKSENDMIMQLQQQLEYANNQLKQYESQIGEFNNSVKQLQSQIDANNEAKLQLEQRRILLEEMEIRNKKDYQDKQILVKEKHLDAEIAQIYDNNPYNDKIRD